MKMIDHPLHTAIVQNVPDGICVVRASDQTIVYVNPGFETMFGCSPGEPLGLPISAFLLGDEDGLDLSGALVDELIRNDEARYEVRGRKKDGTPCWCRGHASAFVHPQHGLVWTGVHADVTREHDEVERLRRDERLLRGTFEAVPFGMWITDADGRLVRSNSAARRLWAGSRAVVGDPLGEQCSRWAGSGDPHALPESAVSRALRRGEAASQIARVRGPDGVPRTLNNSVAPLREGDAVVGAVVVNEDVTRLLDAEAMYSGVIAMAPDGIVALDEARRIILFNPCAERMFARRRDDVLGQDVGILVAETHHGALAELLRDAAVGGVVEPRRLTARRAGGDAFAVEASAGCMQSGVFRRCTLVLRDVSARARAEEERAALARALTDDRAWLSTLFEAAPIGLIAFDAAGKVIHNQHAAELLGADLVSPSGEAYVHTMRNADGSAVPRERMPMERVFRGERVADEEYMIVRPDGSRRWLSGTATPVHTADGRQIGAIAAFEDITPRRRMEQELRFFSDVGKALAESLDYEDTLRRVARLAVPELADGCVMYLLDVDGAVEPAMIHCDDPDQLRALELAIARYVDSDPSQGPTKVVRTGEPELVPIASDEHLARLAVDADHLDMIKKTGIMGYLIVPMIARERTIGALTLLQTRSGRVPCERDVQVAEELARRAALAIDNTRLYLSARGAAQARDDVLAVVAHDIRSPLAVIQYALEKVVRGLRTDAAAEAESAQLIRLSVHRIKRLLTDLLDVSRIRSGTLWIDRLPVEPAELVAEAIAAARPLTDTTECVAEVGPDLPQLSADRERILQVLANLIGNALKFAPRSRQLLVGVDRRGDEVVFRVRDHGNGVPADQLGQLFDRFWQARRTDRRGAGLGLTIAKGIVEAHGGRIWCESVEGLGSTFYFSLPAQ